MTEESAPAIATVRPLMPDALPALHLSDAINPSGIFEARLTQLLPCPGNSEPIISRYESSHRWVFFGTQLGRKRVL
jgi:hypothetical protein